MDPLDRTLKRLRQLANASTSASRISLHRGLRDLEVSTGVWASSYSSFRTLLEVNRLAYPQTHVMFVTAEMLLGPRRVDRLGFWATVRVGSIEDRTLRSTVITTMADWIDYGQSQPFPSYQAVDAWLHNCFPAAFPRTQRRPYDDVVQECERLRTALEEERAERIALEEQLRLVQSKLNEALRACAA